MQKKVCEQRRLTALVSVCAFGAAAGASGQAFNLDFGFESSVPSLDFQAASDQAGIWTIPTTNGNFIDFDRLFDIQQERTDVRLSSEQALSSFGNPSIGGPESLVGLVGDGILIESPPSRGGSRHEIALIFENLVAGAYEVYTYTFSPFEFGADVGVRVNGELRMSSGFDAGPLEFFQEGESFTRHLVNVTDGMIRIEIETDSDFGFVNGLQIVPIPAPWTLAGPAIGLLWASRRR